MPRRPFLPDRPVDQAQDQAALAQGGIPLRAQRRIHELNTAGHAVFTSTLSPAETLVARATGLTALSQVMGSSVYHVGFGGYVGSTWTGGELATLTNAYEHARSLALSRMTQEAALLGAHAVVGVTLEPRRHAWAGDCLEFTALGTAVRVAGMGPVQFPALALMDADELFKLHNAGYWPAGIAMGNCFWHEPHADCVSEGNWFSQPLPTHTRAMRATREYAVQRFRESARRLGAHGVLGVRVRHHAHDREYESGGQHTAFHVEMMLLGTAVVRRGEAQPPARPLVVMDVRDRKPR